MHVFIYKMWDTHEYTWIIELFKFRYAHRIQHNLSARNTACT